MHGVEKILSRFRRLKIIQSNEFKHLALGTFAAVPVCNGSAVVARSLETKQSL